jgi:hypothetical protein
MSIAETGIKLFHVVSEIFLLCFLVCPVLFLIIRVCCPSCAFQGGTQDAQPMNDPEKRRNDALTALVSHTVTIHDLRQTDGKDESHYTEWLDAGVIGEASISSDAESQILQTTQKCGELNRECCNDDHSSTLRRSVDTYNECIDNSQGNSATPAHVYDMPEESEMYTSMADERKLHCFMTCAVCLSDYVEGDTVCWSKNSSCRHVFHQHCLLPWLVSHDTCPSCRWNFFADKDTSNFPYHLP